MHLLIFNNLCCSGERCERGWGERGSEGGGGLTGAEPCVLTPAGANEAV